MSRRNWAFDIAVALLVGVLGQLEAWFGIGETHRQGPLWAQSLLYAVTALLLIARRVHPLAVLAGMLVASLVEFAAVGSPEGNSVALAPVIATYTAGRYLERRQALVGLGLGTLIVAAWATFDPMNATWVERLGGMAWLAPSIIAWLLGMLLRVSSLYREQRRVTVEQQASRAVAEERNRIARELHDVIGHSVSVMTVQASAVRRRLDASQGVEREALETVEATGRQALAEMRRMVGVLREGSGAADEAPDLEPPAGLAQVGRLAESFRSAGLPVSLSVSGQVRELPPGLDLTAYRLVQEGLTNALRHARELQRADVSIAYGDGVVELAVRDDGTAAAAPDGVGNGLRGMRERVAVYGGSLVTRPRTNGGFELVATLPVDPS
ncbi:sensor histidine kinase [Knoellia aerolata]|uniref:sensor histidine kinase n=1 Tax=Knoellia aerolata TaxID=442954 RepID=UPI0012EE82B9|nr:histidine kinase [Knoellia aerolata]